MTMETLTVFTFHPMKFGSRTSHFTTSKYFRLGHGNRAWNIGGCECVWGWGRGGGDDERSCVCVLFKAISNDDDLMKRLLKYKSQSKD